MTIFHNRPRYFNAFHFQLSITTKQNSSAFDMIFSQHMWKVKDCQKLNSPRKLVTITPCTKRQIRLYCRLRLNTFLHVLLQDKLLWYSKHFSHFNYVLTTVQGTTRQINQISVSITIQNGVDNMENIRKNGYNDLAEYIIIPIGMTPKWRVVSINLTLNIWSVLKKHQIYIQTIW